jgi:hypothetical protein
MYHTSVKKLYASALFYDLKTYFITYSRTRGWQYILFYFIFLFIP